MSDVATKPADATVAKVDPSVSPDGSRPGVPPQDGGSTSLRLKAEMSPITNASTSTKEPLGAEPPQKVENVSDVIAESTAEAFRDKKTVAEAPKAEEKTQTIRDAPYTLANYVRLLKSMRLKVRYAKLQGLNFALVRPDVSLEDASSSTLAGFVSDVVAFQIVPKKAGGYIRNKTVRYSAMVSALLTDDSVLTALMTPDKREHDAAVVEGSGAELYLLMPHPATGVQIAHSVDFFSRADKASE